MAETTLKTYEEFTGGTAITPEKIKAYKEYVESVLPKREPQQKSDVWPFPKTK